MQRSWGRIEFCLLKEQKKGTSLEITERVEDEVTEKQAGGQVFWATVECGFSKWDRKPLEGFTLEQEEGRSHDLIYFFEALSGCRLDRCGL